MAANVLFLLKQPKNWRKCSCFRIRTVWYHIFTSVFYVIFFKFYFRGYSNTYQHTPSVTALFVSK